MAHRSIRGNDAVHQTRSEAPVIPHSVYVHSNAWRLARFSAIIPTGAVPSCGVERSPDPGLQSKHSSRDDAGSGSKPLDRRVPSPIDVPHSRRLGASASWKCSQAVFNERKTREPLLPSGPKSFCPAFHSRFPLLPHGAIAISARLHLQHIVLVQGNLP